MKQHKIYLSLIAVLLIATLSCNEDLLYLDPIGDTEANFFQTEEQMTMGVFGVYQKLHFFYTYEGGNWLHGIWLLPGDDLTTQGGLDYETFVELNGEDVLLGNYFTYAYQLIARANTMLQKIEENGDVVYTENPELKEVHRGEVLFLRAWMYFRLWNTYGTAPLVTERITSLGDAYPPNSTDTELLDQAVADLTEAARLLPESWQGLNKGRVTKDSAYGLLCKTLVFRGTVTGNATDFTDAVSAANKITVAVLASDYGDNFDVSKENNAESLFEWQASANTFGNNPWLDNDNFSANAAILFYCGMFNKKPDWLGAEIIYATESLINAYETGDPRFGYTIFPNDNGGLTNVVKYTLLGNSVESGNARNKNLQRNNNRILRYADVLLLKAEAMVRSGSNLSEAVEIINQIRERARMSTLDGVESPVPANLNTGETNPDIVLEWIFQERRIELACEEGHRWYDLRRRHIAGEIDLKKWNFDSDRIDFEFRDHNIVFPLPTSEIVQNPNLNQNANY